MALVIAAAALVALIFLVGYQFRWLLALGLIVLLGQYAYYNLKLTGKGFVNAVAFNEVYQLPKVRDQLDAELSTNAFTFDIAGIKTNGRVRQWEVTPSVVINNTSDRRLIQVAAQCEYQVIDNDQFTKIGTDIKVFDLDLPAGQSKTLTYKFESRISDQTGGGLRGIRCFTYNYKEFDQWDKPT